MSEILLLRCVGNTTTLCRRYCYYVVSEILLRCVGDTTTLCRRYYYYVVSEILLRCVGDTATTLCRRYYYVVSEILLRCVGDTIGISLGNSVILTIITDLGIDETSKGFTKCD